MVNNLIEIRTDARKFLKSYRRPVPNRVPGVGAWFEIMKAVTYLGTIINVRKTFQTDDKSVAYIRFQGMEFFRNIFFIAS